MINRIAQRHVQVDVLPQQYPVVEECLLEAIQAVLGDLATEKVIQAWKEAYQVLAELFIDREQLLYRASVSS